MTIKHINQVFNKYFSNPVYNYIGLVITFYLLVLLLPPNYNVMRSYNMTHHEYHILLFIVELPLAIIWFAAFYGYHRLREYSLSIAKTKEGEVFKKLTIGCGWLAWGFVLPSLISLILGALFHYSTSGTTAVIIFENYFSLIFPLIAFTIISDGASKLISQNRIKSSQQSIRLLLFVFIALGVLYCYFTFRYLDLQHLTSSNNPYYMPVWLLIFTLIIPYLYTWLIGLLAAYEYSLFAKYAKGVIYKRAIQFVSLGVILVIIDSIGVQYIHTIIPRTGHISLNSMLVATYLIYFVIVVGFILISLGANKLKKIEDI